MLLFEQQEGSLCAQHCLNALLQSDYYAADVLSEFAKELDQSERLLDPAQDVCL
jgi:ataxin-3